MEEEVFCGTGSAAISPCGKKKYSLSKVKAEETELFEREYFVSIFTSCCPNVRGLVRVSKLLDMFLELRQGVENDSGLCSSTPEPLEALKYLLDPYNVDPLISSDQFIKCVQGCVGVQSHTPPSSNSGSVPCSPTAEKYSKEFSGDQNQFNKASELEFQVSLLKRANIDLEEQLAAAEEEKIELYSKLNALDRYIDALMLNTVVEKKKSTSDASTVGHLKNETLTSSTQTDSITKSSFWITCLSKKRVATLMMLMFTTLPILFGMKRIILDTNDHCLSYISTHGSFHHSDLPIV